MSTPPSQAGYAVNLGTAPYGAPTFAPAFVSLWFDSSDSAVPGGTPRPASTEYPMPVATAPMAGSPGTTPATPSYTTPAGVTTTQTGGTLSATPGTFVQIAPADASRKAVRFVNISNDYVYAYAGTAATPSPTNSDPVLPGNAWPPPGLGVVPQDAIYMAAKSLANAPYVLLIFR